MTIEYTLLNIEYTLLSLFIINIMTSPFLLLNYIVGSKDRCETTKRVLLHLKG